MFGDWNDGDYLELARKQHEDEISNYKKEIKRLEEEIIRIKLENDTLGYYDYLKELHNRNKTAKENKE